VALVRRAWLDELAEVFTLHMVGLCPAAVGQGRPKIL